MASKRITILFLIDYFQRTGGTEKHLAQLIAGLPPETFSCTLVAFDLGVNPLLDDLRARGVPVVHLSVAREYGLNAIAQGWRLSKRIRRDRYDIVQTFHQKADTYGALVAWLSGVTHVISSRRDTGHLRRRWHFFVNRHLTFIFEAFIVVGDAVRAAAIANDHLPPDRITTIYNGVDVTHFTVPSDEERVQARSRFDFAADDFVVGMIARFRPEKNHDVFFDGLMHALPLIPSLKVLVVGGGPLLEPYRERIARSELGARVVFTGDVPNVGPFLWAMDVGCLTSGSSEGFSNAVLEQMATGLPMIVTNVGGNPEAVVDGENGLVIPPMNAVALSQALIEVYRNRARAVAMGRASRSRVEENFSLKRMCDQHALLYRSLVDGGYDGRAMRTP